jgi:DNA-binding CsgD family transcriptional regulator
MRAGPDASPPEAVLSPSGSVEHAEGLATTKASREALRKTVLLREEIRGRRGPDESGRFLRSWKGLVTARWTLVDRFERGGRRYLVAQENEPPVVGPKALAPRERQVVSLACLGHSGKLIAYELGISDSTVRVLLSRAAQKLRATSREDLLAKFRSS